MLGSEIESGQFSSGADHTINAMREAPTIVLIGAGSTSFGLTTLHDLYADPVFAGATVWLVDLDARPLERMAQRRGRARGGDPARASP